jgi:RimJ/RimL family protein N-acetyltransferase
MPAIIERIDTAKDNRRVTPPDVILVTDSISLHALTVADAPSTHVLKRTNSKHLGRFLYTAPGSLEQEEKYHSYIERTMKTGSLAVYKLTHDEQHVGQIDLDRFSRLSYWIDATMQGKGIVTQAAACLRDFGFEEWDLPEISLDISPVNRPSQAVAQRLGAYRNGTFSGTLCRCVMPAAFASLPKLETWTIPSPLGVRES